MKNIILLSAFFAALMISCKEHPGSRQAGSGDAAFQKLSDEFIAGYLAWRPENAVYLGFHEFDGKTTDFSKSSLDSELLRVKSYEQKLLALDSASLSPKMIYDRQILLYGIRNEIFDFEEMESYSKNPMTYAGAMDVSIYVMRNFAPMEERLRSIIAVEEKAPAIFAAARSNLADSLARPYIETAIQIVNGTISFMKGDLIKALKDVKNDSLMAAFKISNTNAISELKAFAAFLEKEKLPKANSKFELGMEKYKKMLLNGEGISMSPEKILEVGMAELEKEKAAFNASAKIINPNKKPVDVYLDIKKEHPTAEGLISDVTKNVEAIRQFIIDNKIVTIPSEVRVKVKETPQYMRYIATAALNPPGPFEKKATEAYYYITPVDPAWTSKQKEEWLELFDYYTTDITTIHEAYPGHYVQFLHLNASNATKIEKIFGSYVFIEGWAHYTEQMMLEEGFGNKGDSLKAAKYRLAQSGEALLRLCRLCVSIKMHCFGMSVDDATKFFMDNWYNGEKPSHQEAIRGTFDPGYLYYSLGKLQMLKLREDYRKQEGTHYSLQKFNDQVLDNGMPPIRLLREIMLKDKNIWEDIL
jgi:uncharacterized protein (DUF885 family)